MQQKFLFFIQRHIVLFFAFVFSFIFSLGFIYAQDEEIVSPRRALELASRGQQVAAIEREVISGNTVHLRIALVEESDILLITGVDPAFLKTVSTSRTKTEVIFVLQALQSGNTEVLVQRIAKELQRPYLRFKIKINPTEEELQNKRILIQRKNKEEELQQESMATFIESLIVQRLHDRAKIELANFAKQYGKEVGTYGRLALFLFNSEKESLSPGLEADIKEFLSTETSSPKKGRGVGVEEKGVNYYAKARLLLANVLFDAGKKEDALVELITAAKKYDEVDEKLFALMALANLFYDDMRYAEAQAYYQQFINLFDSTNPINKSRSAFVGNDQLQKEAVKIVVSRNKDEISKRNLSELLEDYFIATYRLGETFISNKNNRNYNKAYAQFEAAEKLLPTQIFENSYQEKKKWEKTLLERKIFLKDHFLEVR